MVAFTTNFRLAKPDFNTEGWDTQLNSDFDIIDAVLGQFNTGLTIQGVWLNSTLYAAGITVVDGLTGHIWQLSTTYTSGAAPGTFAQDRAANPTFWTDITNPAISAAASAANALVSANNAAASFASITALIGVGPSTGTGVLVLATGPTVNNITLAGASTFGGTISGTGIAAYLASPPAIGGTLPGVVNATNVSATGNVIAAGNVTVTGNVAASGTLSGALRGFISGLTLSNDGVTPNTILDIAAGQCTDSTNAVPITLGAFTKKTGGVWVAGTTGNGMGTGLTIANTTWYHVFAIIVAGVADVYFDTSVTAANKPAGTTAFRRIGSFLTDGSAHIIAFTQKGNTFLWKASLLDLNTTTTSVSGTLGTLTVPIGVQVEALFRSQYGDATGYSAILFTSPDENDQVVANGATGGLSLAAPQVSATVKAAAEFRIRTDTSGRIRSRGSATTGGFTVNTNGWIDYRGTEL